MIPRECKRLAEVDFPIAVVSRHAAREKSIRHGHPSNLHLWWARRPLASCRAMLLALLLPDPCDTHCPPEFKDMARGLLPPVVGPVGPKDEDLREKLLKFIGDFANWDHAAKPTFLEAGRGLVNAAHPEETPLVVDPFAGGGSIPLEALRLGCEAFASDLNPVACLILKTMLEDIPRHGAGLADELRRVGAEIKAVAKKELAAFYPPDPDGARPIAYLWARTVRRESPNCGTEIPLVRSFWLCKKAKRKRALRHRVIREGDGTPRVEFEIFEPRHDREVPHGTVARAKATCVCCGNVLPPDRVRAQLRERRGGADAVFDADGKRTGGARLLAVVTLRPGEQGRHYRLPAPRDYTTVRAAMAALEKIAATPLPNGLSPVPDEHTPKGGGAGAGRAFSVYNYGMTRWGDLFTARQKGALATLVHAVHEPRDGRLQAATVVSKLADYGNSLCRWRASSECADALFGRQAIPIVWDFAEPCSAADAAGSWDSMVDRSAGGIQSAYVGQTFGTVELADAAEHPLPDDTAAIWFTDPPYRGS